MTLLLKALDTSKFLGAILVLFAVSIYAERGQLVISGITRTYELYVPSGINKPALVLNIHGQNWTGEGFKNASQMNKVADRDKFIVVYPDAINKSWDYFGEHEFAFLLKLIDTLDAKYSIDRSRVYSMGFSQGGVMSFHLACRYPEKFAAIAPTSQYLWDNNCNPKQTVPLRLTFGTQDFVKPSKFMESANKWLEFNKCPNTPKIIRPYPSSNPKSLVTRLVYGPCDLGTEVVVDSIQTGDHSWQMDTLKYINNSEESWAFVKKYSKGLLTSAKTNSPHLWPVFSLNKKSLLISNLTEPYTFSIHTLGGKPVFQKWESRKQWDLSGLTSGVYLLKLKTPTSQSIHRIVLP